MPAGDLTSTQVDRDALDRPFIRDSILTVAAVQGVCTGVAIQPVIAIVAFQGIRAVSAK